LENENGVEEFTLSRVINGKVITTDIIRKIKLEKIKKGINYERKTNV
jgi:hypothetical protein